MADFTYTARDAGGKTQTGKITASDRAGALAALKQKNLHPIVVRSTKAKTGMNMNLKLPGSSGVKGKDLTIFTRQLSTMISAGVPILRALTTLKDQTESPALKAALEQVGPDVQAGTQLSDALAKHPKIFSDIYVNMVAAGEAGGILDTILTRLAVQVEKDAKMKSKLKGAMTYPVVVMTVAIIAVIFLMTSIVPKLTGMLIEAGGELPAMTKITVGVSQFLVHQWPVLIGIVVAALVALRMTLKNPNGKYAIHRLLLKLPIFGKIIIKVNIARFSRTFSSLLGAGVSVLESLETTAGALGNVVIQKALRDAVKEVTNGKPVSVALSASGYIPGIVIQMAAVGEETGQLDNVLNKVAEFYEDEVDTVIGSLSSIIEPILIVGLGGTVGFVIASVLGPISSLQGSIN
jgi:type IV pilus assembly protein PilC